MNCPNCGKPNPAKAKFCENCGTSLRSDHAVRTIRMRCRNCDGTMEADAENRILTCPYCGSRELIVESEAIRLEKLRAKQAQEEAARAEEEKSARTFEKSIFRRILIIFAIFSLIFSLMGFTTGYVLCGLIGLIQTILNVTAWLIGMHTVRTRRRNLPRALFLFGLLLMLPYLVLFGQSTSGALSRSSHRWEDSALTDLIDQPPTEGGQIFICSDTEFSMDVPRVSQSQYRDYVSSCGERGFTEDTVREGNSYTAFDSNGTKLELDYYEYSSEMSISMHAPLEIGELVWPTSQIARLLPKPDSERGLLYRETSDYLFVFVSDTPLQAYSSYVQRCIDSGFDVDYSRDQTYFYASNRDGYKLSVDYYGFQIMEIHLFAPVES